MFMIICRGKTFLWGLRRSAIAHDEASDEHTADDGSTILRRAPPLLWPANFASGMFIIPHVNGARCRNGQTFYFAALSPTDVDWWFEFYYFTILDTYRVIRMYIFEDISLLGYIITF